MAMHNPPHPGEFIAETYMEPFGLSCRCSASKLNVAASTLNRVLKKQSGISPEMALRLSKALGRSPESWPSMQDNYDLSIEDQDLTDHFIQAGKFLKVEVIDHLIISDETYHSFVDSGIFKKLQASERWISPYKLKERYRNEGKNRPLWTESP